jgi:hypothetical protein
MKTGLVISDVHAGSYYSPMPDTVEIEDRTGDVIRYTPSGTQKKLNKAWKDMCKKHYDFCIVNGDVCDGPQFKSMGKSVITTDLRVQAEMAIEMLSQIDADEFFFTMGSGYHSMEDRPLEHHVAKRMDGVYGDDLILEVDGVRIHASHNVPVSASSWQYRSTPLARDLLLLELNKSEQRYGKIDLAIRSHAHYYVTVGFKHQTGIITPCWQTRTPFAVKRDLISPPDIGYVELFVDGDDVWHRGHFFNIGPPSRAVRIKGVSR